MTQSETLQFLLLGLTLVYNYSTLDYRRPTHRIIKWFMRVVCGVGEPCGQRMRFDPRMDYSVGKY